MSKSLSKEALSSINLKDMKDLDVKIILLGDGMSGKTKILMAYGKIVLEYLKNLFFYHAKDKPDNEEKKENRDFDVNFSNWTKVYGFCIEYGNIKWDLETIDLEKGTIGFEDFRLTFPYVYNGATYRVKLIGNDLGGQNIFDHFREVLGKIALPEDNLIIVFDKSRNLSCYNSIQQIKDITGVNSTDKWSHGKNLPEFWSVGNKADLEEHINSKKWGDQIAQSLASKFKKTIEYSIPSLIYPEKEEHVVHFEINNDEIAFPDVEALIYNSIRDIDEKYGSELMSDVNSKALAREITAQLLCLQKNYRFENGKLKRPSQWWEEFSHLAFKNRPLALQYVRTIGIFQDVNSKDELYEKIRITWDKYQIRLPISSVIVKNAIKRAGETDQIVSSMGNFFTTNAVQGIGVEKLFDAILQKSIQEEESGVRRSKRAVKHQIKRF